MSNRRQFYVQVATETPKPIDQESAEQALQPGEARHFSGTSTTTSRALGMLKMDMSDIFDQVKSCIDLAATRLCPGPGGPAEAEIEFGIMIAAEGNVVIATVGSEVHLKVTAKWCREE